MMPLTSQETAVKALLVRRRLAFEPHHVFDLASLGRLSVDFLVFSGPGIVLECTACSSKRGSAISEVRRRSAFIDYRLGLLKTSFPNLVCGALIEAPREDPVRLSTELRKILRHADIISLNDQDLDDQLSRIVRGGT